MNLEKLIIKNKESDMSLIEKWTEKHSELLRFYSTENLTERERNLLRTQMKDYLELIEDLKANKLKTRNESVEVCPKEMLYPKFECKFKRCDICPIYNKQT